MSVTGRNLMPSLSEARKLAWEYDVVPLYGEFIGDLETPISAALKFADEENVFLLESAEEAERFGRYSFLGFDPKRTLSYRDGVYTVVDADGGTRGCGEGSVPRARTDSRQEERRTLAEPAGVRRRGGRILLLRCCALPGAASGFYSRRASGARGVLRRHGYAYRFRPSSAQRCW
jgi:hypothetical protein